jgi:hypothetical protein
MNHAEYLRDLAERLMRVPVMYGTDQSDCSKLYDIANDIAYLYEAPEPEKNHDA